MSKNIILKEVKNNVIDSNITNINDLADNKKNITIEATLIDYKIFKSDKTNITILYLKNNDNVITGLFIGEYNLSKNNVYKLSGNITLIKNVDLTEFNQLINDDINKYIKNNKLLCIKSIQQVESKPLITSIELSAFHNNENDLTQINIPTIAIDNLEIYKISTSMIYLKDGRYEECDECGNLEIKLAVNKLEKNTIKLLLEDICIFSINLFFDNGDKKYYNLPYYSNDGKSNILQRINKIDNKIVIIIDEELKYGKFKK